MVPLVTIVSMPDYKYYPVLGIETDVPRMVIEFMYAVYHEARSYPNTLFLLENCSPDQAFSMIRIGLTDVVV